MATISLRLDKEDERELKALQKATGLSASEAIRRAIRNERAAAKGARQKRAYDIYEEIMAASVDEPAHPATDDASRSGDKVKAILKARQARAARK